MSHSAIALRTLRHEQKFEVAPSGSPTSQRHDSVGRGSRFGSSRVPDSAVPRGEAASQHSSAVVSPALNLITKAHEVEVAFTWSRKFIQDNPEIVNMVDDIHTILKSINLERAFHGLPQFILSPTLCRKAYDFAICNELIMKPINAKMYMWYPESRLTYHGSNTVIECYRPEGERRSCKVTRLVSGAGYGAVACAERWISGKYRRHLSSVNPLKHNDDCACVEWDAYQALMSPAHVTIGLIRDKHDRWIAELLDEGPI